MAHWSTEACYALWNMEFRRAEGYAREMVGQVEAETKEMVEGAHVSGNHHHTELVGLLRRTQSLSQLAEVHTLWAVYSEEEGWLKQAHESLDDALQALSELERVLGKVRAASSSSFLDFFGGGGSSGAKETQNRKDSAWGRNMSDESERCVEQLCEWASQLLYGEIYLWFAGLHFRQRNPAKGAYNLTRSWKAYSNAGEATLLPLIEEEDSSTLSHLDEGGVQAFWAVDLLQRSRFGVGFFHFFVSLVPPSFAWVLKSIGFESDRAGGLAKLKQCMEVQDGLRGAFSSLLMLWVYAFYTNELTQARLLYKDMVDRYPRGALFKYLAGYLHRRAGEISQALDLFIDVYGDSGDVLQIQLASLAERGWCHYLRLEYAEAAKVLTRFVDENTTQSFMAWALMQLAHCHLMQGDAHAALHAYSRIAGVARKHFSYDQYALRQATRFQALMESMPKDASGALSSSSSSSSSSPPSSEMNRVLTEERTLIVLACLQESKEAWSGLNYLESNALTVFGFTVDMVDDTVAAAVGTRLQHTFNDLVVRIEAHDDAQARILYMRGLMLKQLEALTLARECFEAVLDAGSKGAVQADTYLMPHALCELGEVYLMMEDRSRALECFRQALDEYSGYDFDKPLRRRLQAHVDAQDKEHVCKLGVDVERAFWWVGLPDDDDDEQDEEGENATEREDGSSSSGDDGYATADDGEDEVTYVYTYVPPEEGDDVEDVVDEENEEQGLYDDDNDEYYDNNNADDDNADDDDATVMMVNEENSSVDNEYHEHSGRARDWETYREDEEGVEGEKMERELDWAGEEGEEEEEGSEAWAESWREVSVETDAVDAQLLDSLVWRMREPEKGVEVKNRRVFLRVHRKCFVGREAVDWMLANLQEITTRAQAVQLGQIMMRSYMLHHVHSSAPFRDDDTLYRFQVDDEKAETVLNRKKIWRSEVEDVPALCVSLVDTMRRLLQDFQVSERHIDLGGLKQSPLFRRYVMECSQLQKVNAHSLERHELMGLFINIYNLLVMHAVVELGSPGNAFQRLRFFAGPAYEIRGHEYTLNDIEHGILRGNKAPLFSLRSATFSDDEAAAALCIEPMDPRIHFALNCGVVGCPVLRAYEADKLDEQLELAARVFCNEEQNVRVDLREHKVYLSKIFQWYASDFADDERGVLDYVGGFVEGQLAEDLSYTLARKDWKVVYNDYSWESIFRG